MLVLLRAHGGAVGCGVLKASPDDFVVHEQLGFVPDAGGEHLWLLVEKRGWNTEDVAVWLAKAAGIHRLSVGYSGLKDKQAVTRQWFSLHLPGKPDPALDWPAGLHCLSASRHSRKLNRGTHRANRFWLTVTGLEADADLLHQRLVGVKARGVPNYFGAQRMGRDGSNVQHASEWLAGAGEAPRKRTLKSLWLSAMRSHLFNQVLMERVAQGCWDSLLPGDILQPVGSRGLFRAADEPDASRRLVQQEVNPTAPLPGADGMLPSGRCAKMESTVLQPFVAQIDGLIGLGVKGDRRATRLLVSDLTWDILPNRLELTFCLPAGAYATTVMAELLEEKHRG